MCIRKTKEWNQDSEPPRQNRPGNAQHLTVFQKFLCSQAMSQSFNTAQAALTVSFIIRKVFIMGEVNNPLTS